jgi:hypothetical protein
MPEGAPRIENFSQDKRSTFLSSLSSKNEGPFQQLGEKDFLRFVGVPDKLIIDELQTVPFKDRLKKALDLGVLKDVDGNAWTYLPDRPVVLAEIGGEIVPYYRSKKGTGGVKKAELWYPFFGTGHDGWLIKGTNSDFESMYNNPVLQKMQNILSNSFNWDHSLDLKKGHLRDFHPLAQTEENIALYFKSNMLNQVAFGNDEIERISPNSPEADKQRLDVLTEMQNRYPLEFLKEIKKNNIDKLAKLGYTE